MKIIRIKEFFFSWSVDLIEECFIQNTNMAIFNWTVEDYSKTKHVLYWTAILNKRHK